MKSVRTGVLKFSPTWFNVSEKKPLSARDGYVAHTVCIAKLTDVWSLIAARSSSDHTPYITERMEISTLAISSPDIDLDNICM